MLKGFRKVQNYVYLFEEHFLICEVFMPLKIKTEQPTDVFLKREVFRDKGYSVQFSIGKGQVAKVASCVLLGLI